MVDDHKVIVSSLAQILGDEPDVEQVACWMTATTPEAHEIVRANLHRAPMFSGQIQSTGNIGKSDLQPQ